MLNYKVCSECWRRFVCSIDNQAQVNLEIKRFKQNWSKGQCFCIHCEYGPYSAGYISTKSKAPEKCPYVLEHMVNAHAK